MDGFSEFSEVCKICELSWRSVGFLKAMTINFVAYNGMIVG